MIGKIIYLLNLSGRQSKLDNFKLFRQNADDPNLMIEFNKVRQENTNIFCSPFNSHYHFYNHSEQIQEMPKAFIITMNEQYPFFMSRSNYYSYNCAIMVRSVVKTNVQNYTQVLGKAAFIKNLRNKNLIKVENIQEEENVIHIFYENIQSKYDWRDPQIITEVYNQIKSLTVYLTNIGVKTYLKSSRIGVTDKASLKYFLGVDFQWDSEIQEQILSSFYQNQLKKLFGLDFITKSNINKNQSVAGNRSPSIREKATKQAQRKVSFATLPSRRDRIANIEKQMNMIKYEYEKNSPSRKASNAAVFQNRMIQHQQSEGNLNLQTLQVYKSPILRDKNKLAKKFEDRKFSGDIKYHIISNRKLQQKQSDIKSERDAYSTANKLKKAHPRQNNNQEEIETIHSKSRLEQMKYRQYAHIKKSQKNYLQDFLNVLQDDQPLQANSIMQCIEKATRPTEESSKCEETALSLTTEALRIKTRQAILNSRKIINKVKGLPSNNSLVSY